MFVLLRLCYFIFSYSAIFAASLIKRSVQFSSHPDFKVMILFNVR